MPLYFPRTAVSQRLTLGRNTGLLNLGTGSVMGWFRASSLATSRGLFDEHAAFNILLAVEITTTSTLLFTWRTPAATAQFATTASVDDGVWHRFLFVKRASNDYQGWLDETSVGTSANAVGTDATATTSSIGNFTAINADGVASADLARFVALREAITPGEARQILQTGQTGRGKLWHFELDGRVPELTVTGSGATGQLYVAAAEAAPGVSQVGLPPGFSPLTDRSPPSMLDWLVTDPPSDPGPSADQQRVAVPTYVPRR